VSAVLAPVLLATAGTALCWGFGAIPARPLGTLAGLGLAYLVGVAAVTLVETALLVAGLALLPAFGIAVMGCVAIGVALWARRPATPQFDPPAGRRLAWLLPAVLFGTAAVLGGVYAVKQPVIAWDGWSIYGRKAIWLATAGGLDQRLFTDPQYAFIHQDYPLMFSLLEAVPAKLHPASGGAGLLNGWLFLVAYPWAVGYVALGRLRNPVWAIPVVLLTLTPACFEQGLTGYADLPNAVLLGTGVLMLALWLRDPNRGTLAIACLLLAGAANTKNEGLLFAVLALALAFVIVLASRSRQLVVELALGSLAAVLLIAPWRIWVAAHHIRGEFSFRSGLKPAYLVDRSDRARQATGKLVDALLAPGWRWLVVGSAIIAILSLALRSKRAIALYHLGLGVAAFGALVWIDTIDHTDLTWRLATTADRVITVVPFIATSAIIHLTAPRERV
jgi:hypothetical protein